MLEGRAASLVPDLGERAVVAQVRVERRFSEKRQEDLFRRFVSPGGQMREG